MCGHIEFRFLRFFMLYLFQGWGLWKETWRSTKPQEEDLRGMCTRPEGQCRQGCHLQGRSLDSQWPKMSLNHSNRCSDQIVSHETRKTVPRSHAKYRLFHWESVANEICLRPFAQVFLNYTKVDPQNMTTLYDFIHFASKQRGIPRPLDENIAMLLKEILACL